MIGALLHRSRRHHHVPVLDLLILDDFHNGLQQQRIAVQQHTVHILYLRGSKYSRRRLSQHGRQTY